MMNVKDTKKFLNMLLDLKISLTPCLLGHTGLGKTQVIKQIADERKMDLIIFHGSAVEPSDITGLFSISEDKKTDTCAPSWLPYKIPGVEIIKNGVPRNQGFINPNGGIFFIDEINRVREDMRQVIHQLVLDKRIHTYQFPDNYFIFSAANPAGTYECAEFDPALVNKFAWIKFQPEFEESLSFLETKHGRNSFCSWLRTDKKLLALGEDNFNIESMLLTPRIVDFGIELANRLLEEPKEFRRKVLETIMPSELAASYLTYLDEVSQISMKEVLNGKKKEKVKELVETNRLDVLCSLTRDLADFWSTYEIGKSTSDLFKKEEDAIKNTSDFFASVQDEVATTFINELKSYKNPRSIDQNEYFKSKVKVEKLGRHKKGLKNI